MFVRHTQINNGQHHEDEGLKYDYQDVEDSPGNGKCPLQAPRQQCYQYKDQFAGVQVTEQSKGQRDWLGNQTHTFQQEVNRNKQRLNNFVV